MSELKEQPNNWPIRKLRIGSAGGLMFALITYVATSAGMEMTPESEYIFTGIAAYLGTLITGYMAKSQKGEI